MQLRQLEPELLKKSYKHRGTSIRPKNKSYTKNNKKRILKEKNIKIHLTRDTVGFWKPEKKGRPGTMCQT